MNDRPEIVDANVTTPPQAQAVVVMAAHAGPVDVSNPGLGMNDSGRAADAREIYGGLGTFPWSRVRPASPLLRKHRWPPSQYAPQTTQKRCWLLVAARGFIFLAAVLAVATRIYNHHPIYVPVTLTRTLWVCHMYRRFVRTRTERTL